MTKRRLAMGKMATLRLGAALLASTATTAYAANMGPVTLTGSKWLGIDGNWSATEFFVGGMDADQAKTHLLVGTALSEVWVIGKGGCVENEQQCPKFRGGLFDRFKSSSWTALGDYLLDPLKHLVIEANANYGLDTVIARDAVSGNTLDIRQSIVAAINTTEFFNGLFGLGITTSGFNGMPVYSPFSMMVADYGFIPSYTYGYTAGAYYRNNGIGSPSSLVMGGYDRNRFEDHDTEFTLQKNDDRLPQVMIRGIEVAVPGGDDKKLYNWTSNPEIISGMNESFVALIDSSTPYLWLPDSVYEAFGRAMQLTHDKALETYLLTNEQRADLEKENSISFTFSLSSFENHDDFGTPLNMSGVVNITLPGHAFSQVLRYPYKNEAIVWDDKSKPYFPIKRADGDNFIIGRAFFQEAYILTKYDSDTFSIHQAKHPENAQEFDIKEVVQPAGSGFPPPLSRNKSGGLTKSQMIGIVAGVVVACIIGAACFFLCCRRRKKAKKMAMAYDDAKDVESSIMEETPRTPVARIFSKILRRKQSRKSETSSITAGTESNPAEVGADATHEVYELSAPLPAVELDADNTSMDADVDTALGSDNTADSDESRYMAAKRRLDRALAGPVPEYTPPQNPVSIGECSGEKSMQDVSPVDTYRPADRGISPTSSPTHTHPVSNSLPSPMSPHPDWANRMPDLPSPMTNAHPYPLPVLTRGGSSAGSGPPLTLSSKGTSSFDPASVSRSISPNAELSPTSATSIVPPSPIFQRTPIDPTRIVCLGPLPENFQVPSPRSPIVPRVVGPDGQMLLPPRSPTTAPPTPNHPMGSIPEGRNSTDTLGSNFTDMEERMAEEMARQSPTRPGVSPMPSNSSFAYERRRQDGENQNQHTLESPRSQERIDGGEELIHVPQLAERRFSWEEER